MSESSRVCRNLHDLGVFLIGLAAIIFCIYVVFFKVDPLREMEKAIGESFADQYRGNLQSVDANE